jgi:hypothetical protein
VSPVQPVNTCPRGGGSAITVTSSPATCGPLPVPSLTVRVCALEVAREAMNRKTDGQQPDQIQSERTVHGLLALRSVGPEAGSVRFHAARLTKVGPT